ncbi:hypothetical protein B0O99DRAFT_689941 [Bisporella sp. PMI_857]|nr:hypothetical protein B0O99DRAFT_689941 [Bisporella sp. PMI_857]
MFYPSQRIKNSVQWHFIFNSNGERLPYFVVDSFSYRVKALYLDVNSLSHGRNFVEWTSFAEIHAGTKNSSYMDIDWPGSKFACPGISCDRATISAGKYVVGGTSFIKGKQDTPVYIRREGLYEVVIHAAPNMKRTHSSRERLWRAYKTTQRHKSTLQEMVERPERKRLPSSMHLDARRNLPEARRLRRKPYGAHRWSLLAQATESTRKLPLQVQFRMLRSCSSLASKNFIGNKETPQTIHRKERRGDSWTQYEVAMALAKPWKSTEVVDSDSELDIDTDDGSRALSEPLAGNSSTSQGGTHPPDSHICTPSSSSIISATADLVISGETEGSQYLKGLETFLLSNDPPSKKYMAVHNCPTAEVVVSQDSSAPGCASTKVPSNFAPPSSVLVEVDKASRKRDSVAMYLPKNFNGGKLKEQRSPKNRPIDLPIRIVLGRGFLLVKCDLNGTESRLNVAYYY